MQSIELVFCISEWLNFSIGQKADCSVRARHIRCIFVVACARNLDRTNQPYTFAINSALGWKVDQTDKSRMLSSEGDYHFIVI